MTVAGGLPEVKCRGPDHFTLGRQVGFAMASQISSAFASDATLQSLLQQCTSAAGEALLREFESVNRARYPHILDEVAGIAAGSGQPERTVLLANMAQELSKMMTPEVAPAPGCTDVHSLAGWGHSEDVTGQGSGYIVHSTLQATGAAEGVVTRCYTAFCYPGCVAGWAWGFNHHGVAFSINALTPAAPRVEDGAHGAACGALVSWRGTPSTQQSSPAPRDSALQRHQN